MAKRVMRSTIYGPICKSQLPALKYEVSCKKVGRGITVNDARQGAEDIVREQKQHVNKYQHHELCKHIRN